ncbi:MAG: YraN family protein [bacterium]|nr:YraN family protein [bacterium]
MAVTDKIVLGQKGEEIAWRFLENKGYRLLERNVRSKVGELDLVCRDNNWLVFVEVKTRTSTEFGRPEESVTPSKLAKLIRAAERYLLQIKESPSWRIDVVAVDMTTNPPSLEHFQNVTL